MTVTAPQELTGLEELIDWLDEREMKYEIIDGTVVVATLPTPRHEDHTGRLYLQLLTATPPHLITITRYAWDYDPDRPQSFLEPDLGVAVRADVDYEVMHQKAVPLLAVETRSPSTWRFDEGIKRDIYAQGGVASYWLFDPRTPRLRMLELRDGAYVETAVLGPGDEITVEAPFPVTLRLADGSGVTP